MSTFDDLKAIAHIEKAIREGRNPGAIWSEGQGEINGFINRHSHEAFRDEIAKAKIRLNPNNTQDGDVQAYQRRLWKREDEYKREVDKDKRNQTQNSQPFPTTYNQPFSKPNLKEVESGLSSLSDDKIDSLY